MAATSTLGTKRGRGRGTFIDSVLAAIDGFYAAIVQQLRPWAAKAPQLPRSGKPAAEDAGLELKPPPGDVIEEVGVEPPEPGDANDSDDELVSAALETASAPLRQPIDPPETTDSDGEDITWSGAEDRLERELLNEMGTAPPRENETGDALET